MPSPRPAPGGDAASDAETTSELAQQLLGAGRQGRFQVITLTDEEIVAVDGEESVAPRYWWTTLSATDRTLAVAVAARGLAARGWASGDEAATEVETLDLRPAGPLAAVLGLRRSARRVLLAEQKSRHETRARVYYVHSEGRVLEEAVNSAGLHRFSTLPVETAVADLASWCDPLRLPAPERRWRLNVDDQTDAESAAAAHLVDVRLASVLVSVGADDGTPAGRRRASVYVEPERLLVCHGAGRSTALESVGHDDLVDLVWSLAG